MTTRLLNCVDDAAYELAATKQAEAIIAEAERWAAIQVAIMVAQKLIDDEISDMQEAIANRRYQLGKNLLEQAKKTWPFEKAFVDEIMAEAEHSPEYTFASSMIAEVSSREEEAVANASRTLSCRGLGLSGCDEARMRRAMASARTDLVSHAMRAAEARSLALNDRRYSRQYAAMGLSKGRLTETAAMGRLGDSKNSLAAALRGTINSGMQLWGYMSTRWQHGGNYATGPNGMIRQGNVWRPKVEVSTQPEVPKVEPDRSIYDFAPVGMNNIYAEPLPPK